MKSHFWMQRYCRSKTADKEIFDLDKQSKKQMCTCSIKQDSRCTAASTIHFLVQRHGRSFCCCKHTLPQFVHPNSQVQDCKWEHQLIQVD